MQTPAAGGENADEASAVSKLDSKVSPVLASAGGDNADGTLAVSDLDSTISPVSTSWADSTKTDDELEPVDNIVTSTPQPVQMKRARGTPPRGKTKKKKKRSKK